MANKPKTQANRPYTAILTGATGGLGQAIAHAIAPQCTSLLLQGRKNAELQTLKNNLQHAYPNQGLRIDTLQGCLNETTSESATKNITLSRMQNWADQHACNLFIANAGINHFGATEHTPISTQCNIIQTNLSATIMQCHALLPTLVKQPSAQMILVGSMLGYIGYPGNAAYCASKFGLRGYAQALQRELLGSTVSLKYFAPRAINTAINDGAARALQQELGVQADTPEAVAQHLLACLRSSKTEYTIGFPERLYAFLNQLCPWLTNQAIAKQLPTIQKHYPKPFHSGEQS